MNIFVINSGSSSLKYQLFQMPSPQPLCAGLIERIGEENAAIKHTVFAKNDRQVIERTAAIPNHEAGLQQAVALLTDAQHGVIKNSDEINVVGHRVVHGGEQFAATTLITEQVKADIKELFSLAPLHNPANFTGIEVAEKFFTKAKQVAVFDTAFHQTIPEPVFRYALPQNFYKDLHVRAYGFHGTSHKFVSGQAMNFLRNPAAKLISIHLGNGCSIAAVKAGKSIDTSMGFTPLNGLIMGTRSGDIDPSVIFYLAEKGYALEDINTLLNKQSGMLGLTHSGDMRDVNKAVASGDKNAALACEMYAYRVKKYIGAYAAAMNGIDAIIFTAGVGENDSRMRARICSDLQFLNIVMDEEKNNAPAAGIREINKKNTKVKILIVPTNEELEIAKQCYELLAGANES